MSVLIMGSLDRVTENGTRNPRHRAIDLVGMSAN